MYGYDIATYVQCFGDYGSLGIHVCIYTFFHSKALYAAVPRKPATTLSTVI